MSRNLHIFESFCVNEGTGMLFLSGRRASKHVPPTRKIEVAFLVCRPSVHLISLLGVARTVNNGLLL